MKSTCSFNQEVERWFDGENDASSTLESHIATCESCSEHLAFLTECRNAIGAMPATPTIADTQIPSFLQGIADEVHAPRRRFTGLWAMASALTAALIVAVSTMTMLSPGPDIVGAETQIEDVSTEIDGATVEILDRDTATPTIWVNLPEGGEI